MKRGIGALAIALTLGVAVLAAANRATPVEAKALLQKAVAHYKMVGRKQALADFSSKKPPFVDRDLYVACVGPGGLVTAHGGYPQFVGASADVIKDANGKPVGTTIWSVGSAKGEGTIQFPMLNPLSNRVEQKTAYFLKAGEDVCAVGAYNVP